MMAVQFGVVSAPTGGSQVLRAESGAGKPASRTPIGEPGPPRVLAPRDGKHLDAGP